MHRISIPQSTSARAAEYLIKALGGEEMAFKVAGGTTWWQVRAGAGVECEWLAMKKDYREKKNQGSNSTTTDTPPNWSEAATPTDEDDCGCELPDWR